MDENVYLQITLKKQGSAVGLRLTLGKVMNFHFSISSRPALEATKPPIQCVMGGQGGSFLGGNAAEA